MRLRELGARAWLMKEHLIPSAARGTRLLIFHHIREPEVRSFARLIDTLLDLGQIGSPDQMAEPPAGIRYLLSFDDGYESNHDLSRRVLKPRGIRALFFVLPGFVGSTDPHAVIENNMFPGIQVPEELKRELRFMSWAQILDLAADGHTIGSHSMTHKRLSEIVEPAGLEEEIIGSGDVLETRLGKPVRWFAYPFGDLGSISARALGLINRRYDYCCTGIRGLNFPAGTPTILHREHVDLEAPFAYVRMSAQGGLDPMYWRARREMDRMACQAYA